MKKFIWTALFLALAASARAQQPLASKTLSTTTCPGAGCLVVDVQGMGSAGVQVVGTFVGTFAFTVSQDATNYVAVNATPNNSAIDVTGGTAPGYWTIKVPGARWLKIAFTAYTSGTAVVTSQLAEASASYKPPFNGDSSTCLAGDATFQACSGGSGAGVPGGATNTIQVNAGSGDFGGIALNTSTTVKVLEQHSSGLPTLITPSTAILSDVATIGLTTGKLSQFAATSSSELAGVLSDETGTGLAVFSTSPALTTPTLAGAGAGVATLQYANSATSRTVTVPDPGGADSFVLLSAAQTLANKTLTTPTIGSFTNATHNHQNNAGGGKITEAAFALTGTSSQCVLGDGTIGACPGAGGGNVYDFIWGDGTKGRTNARGTITTADPVTFTQTWNASGQIFNAFDISITRTASADQSYYLRARNATGDVFAVKQNSTLNTATGCIELNQSVSGLGVAISTSANNTVTLTDTCGAPGARALYMSVANVGGNILSAPLLQVVAASGGSLRIGAGSPIQWSNTTSDATATKDTGIIRSAAGVVEVNNGTTGTQRDLLARHLLGGGTAPTAGACATSPGTPAGADEVGRIVVGTSPSNTCVVTFGTAFTNAPVCVAENETTSGGTITVTETTSALTMTQFALSTGIARNYTAADSLAWQCRGY